MSKIPFIVMAAATAIWSYAAPERVPDDAANRVLPEIEATSFATVPPAAMSVRDPADSLYRLARNALTRSDYRRAAELFEQITEKYPDSEYAGDAMYWRAFALYSTGGRSNLQTAVEILEQQGQRYPRATTRRDATALSTRISGELARLGSATAAERVVRGAAPAADTGARRGASCPSEDDEDDERIAAMNALMQMDAELALPILRQVLARRDECAIGLRKKAVFILAQKQSPESVELLLSVIRSDPVADIRREAVFWMSQLRGEEVVTVLDSILRATDDSEMRERAIFALSQHDSRAARQALRGYLSRPGISEEMQKQVIFSLGHHSGTEEDAAFLREMFPRVRDPELKQAIIQSVAQVQGEANGRWLIEVATNNAEDLEVRKQALFWMGQSRAALAPILDLYRTIADLEMKEHLIFVLSQRSERAATDKLIEIARTEPNRELRGKAIFWLGQKRDPRVQQLLLEIINQ